MAIGDLAKTVKVLGEALGGLTFLQGYDHKSDEFSRIHSNGEGIAYALLGAPDPSEDLREEPTSVLNCRCARRMK